MFLIPRLSPWATRCRPLRGLATPPELRLALMGRCPRLPYESPSRMQSSPGYRDPHKHAVHIAGGELTEN